MADPVPVYHVIQVRMSALVVNRIGHAQRISTVVLGTAPNSWELVLINYGVTPRVHSLGVSP